MKKAKQSDASESEDGVDRISSLPDPILHLILSGLQSTEEVVRSSILSTRWRYLWTSIPSIDIDFTRGKEFDRNKFKKFVDRVLENNSLDSESFRLCCKGCYSNSTLHRWINTVVFKNIKQLNLLFHPEKWYEHVELPKCMVTCCSLEVLRLSLYERRLIFPKFPGFVALKVLELKNVELFKALSLKIFLESCPLLEDLSLIDCVINRLKILCISCPKLKSLRLDNRKISDPEEWYDDDSICGCVKIICPNLLFLEFGAFRARKYIFKSLVSLKKAVVHPEDFPGEYMDYMFVGISYIESVSTSIDILCSSLCSSVFPVSVPNLKTLELTTGTDPPRMDDLITFLTWSLFI